MLNFNNSFLKKIVYKISRLVEYCLLPFFYIIAFPFLIVVRIISRFVVIRWACLISSRIGHVAKNVELYCCEKDHGINVPAITHIDLFWLYPFTCNKQLKKMWKNHLVFLPRIFMHPVDRLNEKLNSIWPSNGIHDIGCGKYKDGKEILYPPHSDRDIHDLIYNSKPHIYFTQKEQSFGNDCLQNLGIPYDSKYVCLIVRDSAYLKKVSPSNKWNYHDYRNVDISDFLLVSETLAELGFYVVRMGQFVEKPFISKHPKVIDYATNGKRSDFMDIFLCANSYFCITTSSGLDEVPTIFRKPVVYVGYAPLGLIYSWNKKCLSITRHHFSKKYNKLLTAREILDSDLIKALDSNIYTSNDVELLPNSPEDIKDVVIEMKERLENTWIPNPEDKLLQEKFWDLFKEYTSNTKLGGLYHGKFNALYGANFLRNNQWWLD